MLSTPILVLGGGALGLAVLAGLSEGDDNERLMWLINGKRYAISHRIHGPGWDASMYPGFCEFSEPVITGQQTTSDGQAWTEVQFTANWCAGNTQWDVPEEIAISEID